MIIGLVAGVSAEFAALVAVVSAKLLIEVFNYYQHYGLVWVLGGESARGKIFCSIETSRIKQQLQQRILHAARDY